MNGLYFLASDSVFDLCLPFLESVRRSNPELALCLIPFDDRYERVRQLAETYDFDVLADPVLLRACDEIGELFFGRALGHFRKLACWHGPFQRFALIDVDTILLQPLADLWPLLGHWDVITSHSNLPDSRRHTWKDTIFSVQQLSKSQIDFAANTGFIASYRGLFALPALHQAARLSLEIVAHMELACAEQPFLNYLFVTSGCRYTSISNLRASGAWSDRWHECWPGDPKWTLSEDGGLLYDGTAKDILFVHWAGLWERGRRNYFNPAETPGLASRVRPDLPLGFIWRRYVGMANASGRFQMRAAVPVP